MYRQLLCRACQLCLSLMPASFAFISLLCVLLPLSDFKRKKTHPSKVKKFFARNKLAKKAAVAFLKFVVNLSLPFMKKSQAKSKKAAVRTHVTRQLSVFPNLPLAPGPMSWSEHVKAYSREYVFTSDKEAAALEASLLSAASKSAFARQAKATAKETKKAEKKAKTKGKKKHIGQQEEHGHEAGGKAANAFVELRGSRGHSNGLVSITSTATAQRRQHRESALAVARSSRASLLQTRSLTVKKKKGMSKMNKATIVAFVVAVLSIVLSGAVTMAPWIPILLAVVSILSLILLLVFRVYRYQTSSKSGGRKPQRPDDDDEGDGGSSKGADNEAFDDDDLKED